MGTSIERRLAKLEAAHRQAAWRTSPAGRAARARQAIDNGTASLEDYAVGDPDGVARWHRQLLAYGVLVAIREELGWRMHEEPMAVLAFPPGKEAPEYPAWWFQFNARVSRCPPARVDRQAKGRQSPDWLLPESRRWAAYTTLAMGEPFGEPLRRELWQRDGDGWDLSEDALDATERVGMEWSDFEEYFRHECVVLNEVAPQDDELAVRDYEVRDGVVIVPYSEVIRLMDCLGPHHPGTSQHGQIRSYGVIRILPDSGRTPSETTSPS